MVRRAEAGFAGAQHVDLLLCSRQWAKGSTPGSKNGEGVSDLRRALQEAGPESVLMTLWAVQDRETQELTTAFYRKWLGGMEKYQALRTAQLELGEHSF